MTSEELEKKIEVISINDSQPEETGPLVPHERQIVDAVIAIWKEDPSTESLGIPKLHAILKEKHSNWSVSEKRVKTLLKKFGLAPNASNSEQFTYANEIKSEVTPDIQLPPKVQIIMTTKRGKGLYAKNKIAKGDLIWEETPLFFIPPLANINLVKSGKACSYCGKLLQAVSSSSVLKGLDCTICPEVWCSQTCKKLDSPLHGLLKHNIYNPNKKSSNKAIDSESFLQLQEYCLKESWNALYAITLIYANIIIDKSGVKGKQFRAMARVSQDVRYKALSSSAGAFDSLSGGALFVEEQQENLWKEGYEKFIRVFPTSSAKVDYKEFLYMMGTYNINNVDSCIYLTQSHLNHICDPNTSVETSSVRTEGLKVFAARDIKAGEELTTTYVNPSHTVQQRQRELRVNWGFICSCQKCKDDIKNQHKRKSSSVPAAQKSEIRKMLNEVGQTIGEEGIDLDVPVEFNGERRKSVRFDEKVISVKD
ncbi:uncharacterized protein RJT20DRAFT_125785 [Scheffersomyces xylosifermentans]|uniref:uncharacterized protein n=1 Tax=Scheffersomyces xylosifermentans TaxID=1304137 RepID=UPI00315E022D